MRGKSVKKIKKFVDHLIANTPAAELTKSKEEMVEEVKEFWKRNNTTKEFIDKVLKENIR